MDPLNIAPFGQMQPQPVDLPGMAQPKGMFGGGGWKDALMAAAAGFLGRRNPGAAQGLFHMMQQKQQQALEEAQYQRQRQDKFSDWRQQYDYELHNPKSAQQTEYERALIASGVQPGSPEWAKHMGNFVNMRENPPFTYVDPTTGAMMMGARTPPQQTAPPGVTFTPLDDGGPGASPGGFPGRY